MNRFSRIRHHVDIKDVKRRHLEESSAKKLEEKRLKEEAQQIKAKYEKCKVDWRSELDEGMTTGKLYATTFPSEGDTPIEQLSASDTESFADAINMFGAGANNNSLDGATIRPNGTGTGGNVLGNQQPYGGFNVGGDYLAFENTGTSGSRFALMKPIDSTAIDTLTITAIKGDETNGGEMAVHRNAQLFVIYKTPSMNRALYLSQDPNIKIPVSPSNRPFLQSDPQIPPQDSAILTLGGVTYSFATDFQFSIPAHAREKGTVFGLFQLAHSGVPNAANYGVTDIKFQRKAPVNAFVSLEDPEASSFVRVGQGTKKSSPQKRKKRVQDILSAGKEYANKYLGSDFPGSSTELSPETSPEVSSVDQEIADVQQQKRDSMSQQTKDRFDGDQPETMNNEPKVPDFTKFNNSKGLEDAFQATYQQYSKDLRSAYENYGKEVYKSWLEGAQSNWDNLKKNRPEGPRSPRPTFDEKQEKAYIRNVLNGMFYVYDDTPAGKVIKALKKGLDAMISAYADATIQLRKRSQKDKAVNPQAEPVKDEGGEDKLDNDLSSKDMDNYLDSLPPSVRDDLLNGRALPEYTLDALLFSLLPQTRVVSTAVNKINMAARAIDKWWNKGRNVRVKDESTADWRTLMLDDFAQRGQSDAAFKAGKTPRGIGRPDQAFNPFRPGSKGGPGSGPTPAVRQAFERFFKNTQKGLVFQRQIRNSKSVYKKKREALSVDKPIVTSPRSSKKSKKKNKEG